MGAGDSEYARYLRSVPAIYGRESTSWRYSFVSRVRTPWPGWVGSSASVIPDCA